MTSKASGFVSFNQRDLDKLIQDANKTLEGFEANLIENKKATAKLGDAITLETSVQVCKESYTSGAF